MKMSSKPLPHGANGSTAFRDSQQCGISNAAFLCIEMGIYVIG